MTLSRCDICLFCDRILAHWLSDLLFSVFAFHLACSSCAPRFVSEPSARILSSVVVPLPPEPWRSNMRSREEYAFGDVPELEMICSTSALPPRPRTTQTVELRAQVQ